jgi:hypothetical protein
VRCRLVRQTAKLQVCFLDQLRRCCGHTRCAGFALSSMVFMSADWSLTQEDETSCVGKSCLEWTPRCVQSDQLIAMQAGLPPYPRALELPSQMSQPCKCLAARCHRALANRALLDIVICAQCRAWVLGCLGARLIFTQGLAFCSQCTGAGSTPNACPLLLSTLGVLCRKPVPALSRLKVTI